MVDRFDLLPEDVQQRIKDLAAAGRLDPDPDVASESVAWARQAWNGTAVIRAFCGTLVDLVVGGLLGDYSVGVVMTRRFSKLRAARRICRIVERRESG